MARRPRGVATALAVVALVAGLLVIGEMLARTGVARAVGDWILKKGGSNETRLLILIMVGAITAVHLFVQPLDIAAYQLMQRLDLMQPGGGS